MTLSVHPLTLATWPPYAALIERHHGVWGGCWCMAFHPEGANGTQSPDERRALKMARVADGTAQAALVFDADLCVGWCQFGLTATLPRIKNRKEYDKVATPILPAPILPAPILPDWRITCFFVDGRHRRRGVARLALAGAVAQISALGGGTVEGYPDDTATQKISSSFLFNGTLSSFGAQGFARVRPLGKTRWVMGMTIQPGA